MVEISERTRSEDFLTARVPPSLAESVDGYRTEQQLETKSEAIRQLVQKGLAAVTPQRDATPVRLTVKVPQWFKEDLFLLEVLTNLNQGDLLQMAVTAMGRWTAGSDDLTGEKAIARTAVSFFVNCLETAATSYDRVPFEDVRTAYLDWCDVFGAGVLAKEAFADKLTSKYGTKGVKFRRGYPAARIYADSRAKQNSGG
jgi:hypothetical protein